jgi:hypothetical protein
MKDEEKGKYVVRLKQVSKRNQSWQDIHTNEGVAQNPPTRDCVPYKPPIPYNEVVSSVVVDLLTKNRLADAVYQKWETWNKQNQVSKWQEFLDRGIISQEEDNWLNGKIDSKPKEYSIGRFVTFLMSALRKHFQILILQQIEKDIADSCFQLIKEKDRVLLQQLLKFNYCECNDTNVLYVKKGDLTKAFKKLIILFSSKFNAKYCEEFHEINSRVCGGL